MRFFNHHLVFKKAILILLCFIAFNSYGQFDEKKTLRRAQRFFLIEDFERSVENYKILADSFPKNFEYNYETALIYFYDLDMSLEHEDLDYSLF